MDNAAFPAENLLDTFFTVCESKFRFLEQMHGLRYISGLVEYKNNYKIITPYHNQKISGPFLGVTRYESDTCAFEIQYGDEQFLLECYVYYGPINRFTLEDILYATRKMPPLKLNEYSVTRKALITSHIDEVSQIFKAHAKLILEPNDKHIERTITLKEKRLEQALRKRFTETLKECARAAAKAYREKNFKRVVSLLAPYETYLAAGEKKKLDLAKKYLLT